MIEVKADGLEASFEALERDEDGSRGAEGRSWRC